MLNNIFVGFALMIGVRWHMLYGSLSGVSDQNDVLLLMPKFQSTLHLLISSN